MMLLCVSDRIPIICLYTEFALHNIMAFGFLPRKRETNHFKLPFFIKISCLDQSFNFLKIIDEVDKIKALRKGHEERKWSMELR